MMTRGLNTQILRSYLISFSNASIEISFSNLGGSTTTKFRQGKKSQTDHDMARPRVNCMGSNNLAQLIRSLDDWVVEVKPTVRIILLLQTSKLLDSP
jgi:hypothetical protein